MIIDAHAHIGHGRFKSLGPEDLLRQMDENGVDQALVCPVEEQIVIRNHEGNQFILSEVRRHPTRFIGFAVANPWFEADAVNELEWALGEGLRGLKLHPVLQGFSVNGPLAYPLIEVAARHKVPVYVHTGTPHFGEPLKLAELARRYPEVWFLLGHCAFSDFWNDLPLCHRYAPNILFETSRNEPASNSGMAMTMGVDTLVFGSNAPEALYSVEIPTLCDVFTEPADRDRVLAGNIARVLGGLQ